MPVRPPWRTCAPTVEIVINVAPTAEFLRRLPRGKLPDRKDFTHYGLNHDERIANWRRAIG
ncbi:MAG: lysophospholipase [Massilia sp.]|jgi:hypothetical protein|nr:lysophospholipase [Massilia sp.]